MHKLTLYAVCVMLSFSYYLLAKVINEKVTILIIIVLTSAYDDV